jgi:hypothetical protein
MRFCLTLVPCFELCDELTAQLSFHIHLFLPEALTKSVLKYIRKCIDLLVLACMRLNTGENLLKSLGNQTFTAILLIQICEHVLFHRLRHLACTQCLLVMR